MVTHRFKGFFFGLVLLMVVVANFTLLWPAWQRNTEYLAVIKTLLVKNDLPATQQILEHSPASPSTSYLLGLVAFRQADLVQAQSWWGQSFSGGARYPLLVRKFLPTDLQLAQQAVRLYPSQAANWRWLGDALADQPMAALEAYQNATRLDPTNYENWAMLGEIARKLQQEDLARQAFQKSCDLNPRANGYCFATAILAFAQKDWKSVIYYFERGYFPESADGWAMLIRAAQNLGLTEKADRYTRQAQQEYPADYADLLQKLPE